MKNFKYLFLLILMVSFCVQPAVFAQEEEAEAAAVSDYQKLVAFGVIEDEADLISEQVLRGDFARFVIKISGIDAASVAGGQLPFSDVSTNDKNYEYIRAAYTLGLINGYSETEFGPEEPIMFQQAVKILLNVIGYEPIAAQKGGYPTGYLLTASDTGVLKGIGSINQQAALSAKIAARLLLNALDTEILVQESVGETYKYTTIKGQTLLSEKLDIYRITGIMQSNMFSSLDGDSTVGTDRVQIGSGIYETGLTDAADYLGCNVEAYYREDKTDNLNILVYAGLSENKNDVVAVAYKDIETGAVTKDSFVYRETESGKKVNLKIDRVATLLLNGCLLYTSRCV